MDWKGPPQSYLDEVKQLTSKIKKALRSKFKGKFPGGSSRDGGRGGDGGSGGSGSSSRGSGPNNRDNDGNGRREEGGDGSGERNSKISFKEKGGYDNRTGKRPTIDKDYSIGQLV